MRKTSFVCTALLCSALLTSTGCSDPPKAEKKAEKPLEPLTGREAYWKTYGLARNWATDVQPLRVKSLQLPGVKVTAGKAGAWEVVFVSPSKGRSKMFTYSIVEAEGGLHKGPFAGPEESYSGPRGQERPFLTAAFKIDTDAAWETASKKSEDVIKKAPDTNIIFLLESTPRFPNPAWRVVWGDSISSSGYSVFVDATSGQFLEKVRG